MARNSNLSFQINRALANNRAFKKQCIEIAEAKFAKAKSELIQEFSSHPVSKEIEGGPNANNISGTLGGYGNLFSFIGFNYGANPVSEWVAFLQNYLRIKNRGVSATPRNNRVIVEIQMNSIKDSDLKKYAPIPWNKGRSWVEAIERGLSGFGYYLNNNSNGRSKGGIQAENQIRPGNFKNVKYWSAMWANFIRNLNK